MRPFFRIVFGYTVACMSCLAQTAPSGVTVAVQNGTVSLRSQSDPQNVTLSYNAVYQPGDHVVISAPPQDNYLVIQVDDKLAESLVYLPSGQVDFTIPIGKFALGYDPQAFIGAAHVLHARVATPDEIATYRNIALNPLDQRNQTQYFPHATASSVTREDPVFFERNAIDGNTQNSHHGKWPYESWGNGLNQNPWLKIDFGREVTVDKVRLFIRSDFPHDTYWTQATLQFSDGTSQEITLVKTADPQEFKFSERKVSWIQVTNFKQPTEKLGYAAITEMEVYGKDTP